MSATDVGIYVAGYTLGSVCLIIPRVFSIILPAKLFKSTQSCEENSNEIIHNLLLIFLILSAPYLLFACMFSKEVLMYYGDPFVAQKALMIYPTIVLSSYFYGVTLIKINILFVRMRLKEIFKINTYILLINIFLNVIFLLIFENLFYSALATLISYFISMMAISFLLKDDDLNATLNYSTYVRVLLAIFFMSLVFLVFDEINFLSFLFGLVIYFILIAVFFKNIFLGYLNSIK
jgi:O-antigen/teichoic acid export membrane protein